MIVIADTGPIIAEELRADQIIIDEIRGRRVAEQRRLSYTGTLGELAEGAKQGLVELRTAIDRLRETSFYVSAEVLNRLIGRQ